MRSPRRLAAVCVGPLVLCGTLLLGSLSQAFVVLPIAPTPRPFALQAVDPQVILQNLQSLPPLEAGIVAAVSAAAGIVTQQPRIQQLELELIQSRQALNETKIDTHNKIEALEDKLFALDQEFEGQTARFKRQYDLQMKNELERMTAKIKTDYKYKMEIELEREKSKKLEQTLEQVNGMTDREAQLSQMRIEKERVGASIERL